MEGSDAAVGEQEKVLALQLAGRKTGQAFLYS